MTNDLMQFFTTAASQTSGTKSAVLNSVGLIVTPPGTASSAESSIVAAGDTQSTTAAGWRCV